MSVLIDYLDNKSKTHTVTAILQGETQLGKSTSGWYIMRTLHRKRYNEEWDFKKYCARSLEEFIDMFDKYDNSFIVYEEASRDLDVARWYDTMNRLFNILLQTQAYKHNLVLIVMPMSLGISKRQRRFINIGMEVIKKIDNDKVKATVLKPTIYKRTFWKLDDEALRYKFLPITYIKYTTEELKKSKEYTQWLIDTLKKDVMNDIKRTMKKIRQKEKFDKAIDEEIDIKKKVKVKMSDFDRIHLDF